MLMLVRIHDLIPSILFTVVRTLERGYCIPDRTNYTGFRSRFSIENINKLP